jgi:hypothetical protein
MSGTQGQSTVEGGAQATVPAAGQATLAAATGGQATVPGAAGGTTAAGEDVTLKTVLTGTDDKGAAAPPTWPEDWRTKAAGDDAKLAKRLERFADPTALAKSLAAAEAKIHSGVVKEKPPAADAKPEDVAAWRKDNGIPAEASGYLEKLPDGVVIGDADKPLMEKFVADMHGANAEPALVHKAIASYYKIQADVAATRAEADIRTMKAAQDALNADWGPDYRRNINALVGFLDTGGDDVREGVMNARLPDGTPIMNNPAVVKFLLGAAMEINPAATVVPGAGASAGRGIDERIDGIVKMMGDPKSDYWKNEKVQQEYRDLIVAREKMQARAR